MRIVLLMWLDSFSGRGDEDDNNEDDEDGDSDEGEQLQSCLFVYTVSPLPPVLINF